MVEQTLAMAKVRGMNVIFNPSPLPLLAENEAWRDRFPADWVVVNEEEAAVLYQRVKPGREPTWDEQCLTDLAGFVGSAHLIVTLGDAGARGLIQRQKIYKVPAIKPPLPVVDTIGAGDSFTGFFFAAFYYYESVWECIDALDLGDGIAWLRQQEKTAFSFLMGTAAGSLAVTKVGAFLAVPSIRQVVELLISTNPEPMVTLL